MHCNHKDNEKMQSIDGGSIKLEVTDTRRVESRHGATTSQSEYPRRALPRRLCDIQRRQRRCGMSRSAFLLSVKKNARLNC